MDNNITNNNLNITATPIEGKNYVHLEWNNAGAGYTYRVYSKGQDEAVYQSIPSKGDVTVLNIYPSPIQNTGLSGNEKDLDGNPIPDSGILKTWLEKEKIDEVKIESISLTSFNTNPSKYLYKSNGKWNFDCVFYGMWNLWSETMYPNDTAIEYLRTFIHEGGGFMTSHHTIGYTGLGKGINKLANELGVEVFGRKQANSNAPYSCRDSNGNLFSSVSFEIDDPSSLKTADASDYWNMSTKVQIAKKGLLTNYPFEVGQIGTVFDIPLQHGLSVFGKGDVWMTSVNPTGTTGGTFKEITVSPSTGAKGTNNFYVHTYNNTAIINSGHSFPNISQAEVRIIANTLYYLAQLTSDTSCDDHKGQDLTAPDKASIISVSDDAKNLNITYSKPNDNGTKYEYYVKASDGNAADDITSNTVSAVNTSGIAGFSYVVDNIENTEPDNKVITTDSSISVPLSSLDLLKPIYVHIKAIDNAGNYSETIHYEYKYIASLKLDKTEMALKEGESDQLAAITDPPAMEVTWASSDTSVAIVDSTGKVTAVKRGKAAITATTTNGSNLSASCTVTVENEIVLNVEPEKDKIHLHENAVVNYTIQNIKDIAAEDAIIKYDSSKLQFIGANEVKGIKLVKLGQDDNELRIITASEGLSSVVDAKRTLLKLYFKGIASGEALVDVTKGKVSDGIEMEKDLYDEECGQATIIIDDVVVEDVNHSGEFTLLDLAIDARHLGEDPKSLPQYDTDQVLNGAIDNDDLLKIGEYMLENPNYKFN